MKVVYCLVSNINDYFYEQCLTSVVSLKRRMKDVEAVVLVDDITYSTLDGKRRNLFNYAKIIKQDFPAQYSAKIRSRLLKMCTRDVIEGPFLYLDVDTIIVDDLSDISKFSGNIAMVLDKHSEEEVNFRCAYIENNAKKMHYSVGYDNKHFNGGVFFANDTEETHEFFELWKELYLECVEKELYIDQTSLNEANFRLNGVIKELSGEWNVQLDCGIRYIHEAKIFHYSGYQPFDKNKIYFNLLPFELCDDTLFQSIKETGEVNESIMHILDYPQRSFKHSYILPNDCIAYDLLFTNHFRVLKYLYIKHKFWFGLMEKIYKKLFKVIYKRA